MAFYATNFIFDNNPSEEYGLIISSDDGESSTDGHTVELITEEIYRRHTPYFYGVKQSQMITIPASIRSINGEITAEDSAYIQRWLFGQLTYKELRIVQPDMAEYYYKCFLLDPSIVRVGNIIIGYDFTIQLDSPFAYGQEETTIIPFPYSTSHTIINNSDNNYYTYPIVEIEVYDGSSALFAKVTNLSDNNRVFELGTYANLLNAGEYIIIDNDLQTIVSYTNVTQTVLTEARRINNLVNGYFFRLVPGINNLVFGGGDLKQFIIKYRPLKRMT